MKIAATVLEEDKLDEHFIVEYSGGNLYFSGEINFHSAHQINRYLKQIEQEKEGFADKTLCFYLSSNGGDVTEALKLHDAIVRSPLQVVVIAEGLVASAATLLLCAGQSAKITQNSFLLIHEISSYFGDTYSNNKRYIAYLDQLMDLVLGIYNKKLKSKITKATIDKDWFINSAQALELGLVDEIL
jgi:ATP-dependent protease ClpP protease subunit